jgi:hypothetical protein
LEYFIEEIKTKAGLDFFLEEYSILLRKAGLIESDKIGIDDICSDHLTLLQKAVALNKIELIDKFVNVFKMDINRTSDEYKLPPIFIALSKRKVRSTELLIRKGADLMSTITLDGNSQPLNIFDVICANRYSFHRTDDKMRRVMAQQFRRKVIDDAKKSAARYPDNSSPHYLNNLSTWPKIPPIKYRNNDNLRQFH